jgi:hypothetical protein
MKIIDKTPQQDDKGNLGFMARIQGMLKYGIGWFAEMEAQKIALALLDHGLEKSFVVIRNFTLPGSDIVIPLILIGLGGIYIIYVTGARGHFEAKGDQWNTIDNSGNSQPASVNLLDRVTKLTRAFQKYLEINKISVPGPIEPIVIAIDPGAHIETVRPIAKIVKSDAIKVFIGSILQATPIWRSEQIYMLADRIVEPRLREDPEPVVVAPVESSYSVSSFDDSTPARPFDANDLGFSFEEENSAESQSAAPKPAPEARPQPAQPRPAPKRATGKFMGMSVAQVIVLAGMLVVWCLVMTAFVAFLYANP